MSAADSQPTSTDHEVGERKPEVVTSGAVGRELKRLRRLLGVTQAVSAKAIGVSRANLTQWETGKYLPSEQNARQLDDYFGAGNALVNLIDRARSGQEAGTGTVADANFVSAGRSLRHVFQHVGRTLADNLIRDDQGKPIGWPHNLMRSREPTALNTAYGIKAMLLVDGPYVDFGALTENLLAWRSSRGWVGRSGTVRAERNAAVLDALFRIGTPMRVDDALSICERSLDQYSRTRPYLLSALLQTVVRLRPDAPLVAELTGALLDTRLDFDGIALWPENSQPGLVLPQPSAPHTARAVVALQDVLRCQGERTDISDAVGQATQWLAERIHPDDAIGEELVRPKSNGAETSRVIIRHFTPAWVVQALAVVPEVPVHQLHRALGALWERYDPNLGLWAWSNGSLPIWMTHDALAALASAALTLAQPPLSPPEDKG